MDRLLDSMRTKYVRLPPAVKAMVGPTLRAIPFSLRFGKRYWRFREDIARSRDDPEFVRRRQIAAWRELLARAERTSRYGPFIRSTGGPRLSMADWNLSELDRFPILPKQALLDDPASVLTGKPSQFDVRFTSGSSGRPPLKIFLDPDRSVGEAAFLHEIWARGGFRLGDSRAILRDVYGNRPTRDKTWRYDPTLRELWLSPFFLTEETMNQYLDLLARYRIRFISGIPSAISILAQHALAGGWAPPSSLRGVLTASEALFPHQRQLIARAFGPLPVVGHYGMSERVAVAGDLATEPDTYEFEPLYGIAELVDDAGKRISRPGQSGRIICTGLFSKAMALIRYEVGDQAILVQAPSYENCFRLRVRAIRSRWAQEFVIGRGGQKISVISLDQENYFGVIREYQYLQVQPGHVTFRAVPCPGKTRNEIDRILNPMRAQVRDQLTFDLELLAALPVGATGKRKLVDQRIPESAS